MRAWGLLGIAAAAVGCAPQNDGQIATTSSAVSTDPGAAQIQAYINSAFYADTDILYSFLTPESQEVDCIDFYAQHSVKGFLEAGLSVSADNLPSPPALPSNLPASKPLATGVSFDVNGHARKCPEGTVAKSRPTVAQIEAVGGLAAFNSRRVPHPQQDPNQHDCYWQTTPGPGYDHAVGYQYGTFTGGLTFTPVYAPVVAFPHYPSYEHSLSELWMQTGSCESWVSLYGGQDTCTDGNAVQSLEVGWMVGESFLQGNDDVSPYLFVFITQDGYSQRNCYADQSNNGVSCCNTALGYTNSCWIDAPGIAWPYAVNSNWSSFVQPLGSPPSEASIQVWNSGSAWNVYIDGHLIGWYPSVTFTNQMMQSASYMQVGGEVFDSWPCVYGGNCGHTSTGMGSGIDPDYGYGYSAYHRNVNYIDGSGYHDATLSYVVDTPPAELDEGKPGICGYDAAAFGYDGAGYNLGAGVPGTNWHEYFFFGGYQEP